MEASLAQEHNSVTQLKRFEPQPLKSEPRTGGCCTSLFAVQSCYNSQQCKRHLIHVIIIVIVIIIISIIIISSSIIVVSVIVILLLLLLLF